MRRPRLWIFDLDNTLHDAGPHIFPHINRAMTDYIRRHLRLDEASATALRQDYWHRYGATLLGLVRHHGTDPAHFLWHTHQFANLSRLLVFDKTVRSALQRLPGRKVVFSNAPWHYAQEILSLMRIEHLFASVYAIEDVRFRPKPALSGFLQILRQERVAAADAAMVEDSAANLAPAKKLGMMTVWVSAAQRKPAWVDVVVPSVNHLARRTGGRTRQL